MEQQYFINMLQILDAATERGTWKGGEIERHSWFTQTNTRTD